MKKTKKVVKKSKKKVTKKTYNHDPIHYNRSENVLVDPLNEDLKDAWLKLRDFGQSLGDQRVYASGRAIMFSKKVCYFFVRPKKTYLEVVVFLTGKKLQEGFKSVAPASKTKFAHTFKLVHADQIEGALTDAITKAFNETPSAKN